MKTLIRCLLTKGSLKKNSHDEQGYDVDGYNNSTHLSCHSVPVSNKSYGGCSSRTAATSTHSLAVSNHTVGTQGLLNSVHGVGIVSTTLSIDDEEKTVHTTSSTRINGSQRKKKSSRRKKNRDRQDRHIHDTGISSSNNPCHNDDPSLLSYGLLKLMAKKGQWNELQHILLNEEENEKENDELSYHQPKLYVVGHTYASNGDTFLHMVCRYHPPVELIEYLLNQRSKELATREVNHLGQTPLHVASASGASLKVIELLLQANPQIASMQDTKGNTPLHLHLIHTSHEKVCDPGLQHNIIITQHSNEPCSHEEKRKEAVVVQQADDLSEPDDVLVHMHHTLNTAVAKTSSFRKHNHPSIGKDDKTYKPSIKRSNLKKTTIKKAPTCVASSSASVGDTSSYSKKYDITISNKKFFKRCKNKKVGRKDSIKSIMEAFHEKQRKEGIPIVVVSPEDEEHYYDSCSDNGISSEHQHHNKGTVTMTEEDYLLYHSKQQLNSSSKEKYSLDDDPLFPRVALVKKIYDGRKKGTVQGSDDCSNINTGCDADVTEKHQCYHQNKREHEMTDLQVMKKNNKLLVTGPNEDIVRSLVESSTSCLVVENDDGFTVIELAILNDAEYKMVVELQKYSRSFLRQRQRQERKTSKAAAAASVATAVGHHPNRSDDNRTTLQAALSESSMQSAASAPSSFNSKIPIHKTEDAAQAVDRKAQIKNKSHSSSHDAATTKSMSYACRRMRQAHTHVRQHNDDESMENNHLSSSSLQAYMPSSSSTSSIVHQPRVYHNAAA